MMNSGEPLLGSRSKSSSGHFRASIYIALAFGILCIGFWDFMRSENGQEQVGVEKEGTNLPGCKVVTGMYFAHRRGASREIHLAQKACIGRDLDTGAAFTVFGTTMDFGGKLGDIQDDGTIRWPGGEVWKLQRSGPRNGLIPTTPTSKKEITSETTCPRVEGSYKELDENGKITKKFVAYAQTKCRGTVFRNMKLPVQFTLNNNVIHMLWIGNMLEGEVDPESKTITWSNGYTHIPTTTGVSPGAVAGHGLTAMSQVSDSVVDAANNKPVKPIVKPQLPK